MSIESEYLGVWCVVELAWTSQVCLTHLKALQSKTRKLVESMPARVHVDITEKGVVVR